MTAGGPIEEVAVYVGGDELTRLIRFTRRGDTAELLRAFAEEHAPDRFEKELAAIGSECDSLLQQLGLPRVNDVVVVTEQGTWRPAEPSDNASRLQKGVKLTRCTGATHILKTAAPFSKEWYAAKIGELCWDIAQAPNPGDSVRLRRILQLGYWLSDRSWRLEHKPSILTGRTVREGAKLGGHVRAKMQTSARSKVIAAIEATKAEKPHLSVARAAELVAARGIGASGEANRQLWYKHQKRKL